MEKEKMKKIIFTAVLIGALSGCSSIVSKSEYSVAIATNPGIANFTIVDEAGQQIHTGVTPSVVTLKSSSGYFKGASYTITFEKEGHVDKIFTMTSSIDGWYFGNILFGGVIGMLIVDPITGSMYNLPERIDVSLNQSISKNEKNQMTIATIDSLSEFEKAKLVKIN
jgi:hypothetical protein